MLLSGATFERKGTTVSRRHGAAVRRSDAGQVVGKQDQRVGLLHFFGRMVFFFDHQLVRARKLFERGYGKPLVFLQLSRHNQPFAAQGRQSGAAVLPFGCQDFNGDAPGIFAEHVPDRVYKGGFPIPAGAVSHDDAFLEHLADGGHSGNHLEVCAQIRVSARHPVEELAPHAGPRRPRRAGGDLGAIGFRVMRAHAAAPQVHNPRRGCLGQRGWRPAGRPLSEKTG